MCFVTRSHQLCSAIIPSAAGTGTAAYRARNYRPWSPVIRVIDSRLRLTTLPGRPPVKRFTQTGGVDRITLGSLARCW
jgi:hypothetical protein